MFFIRRIYPRGSQDPAVLISITWYRIRIIIITGLILVFLIGLYVATSTVHNSFMEFFYTVGCGLLVGGASFAAGGLGGFIFGIPSLAENKDSGLKYNDNLIQISDWLTKIIVGVGLVELSKIPTKVSQLGDILMSNFGGDPWGKPTSLAIVFYFLLFGFLIIYFWTRTDFTTIIKKTDDDLQTQLAKKDKQLENNEKQIEKLESLTDSIVASKTQEYIKSSDQASDAYEIETLKQNFDDPTKKALDELKEKVKDVLRTKSIIVPEDIQKGRWGGKSENNGKTIQATVNLSSVNNFYEVLIKITDTTKALDVPVAIFVHDSFGFADNVLYVVPNNGEAKTTLLAYEAFTVGVLFADGTELELDLNDQPQYPEKFYWGKNDQLS